MATLQLDTPLLTLLARGRQVRKYLDQTVTNWTWRLDLQSGEILFLEQGTGRILLSSSFKLVGTEDRQAKTFVFAWADPELHEEWGAVSGLGGLRVAARAEGFRVFDEPAAFPLERSMSPSAWALSVASFLGSSFVFESQDRTIFRYLVVEDSLAANGTELSGAEIVELIEWATRRYRFDHRVAIYAYLGKPTGAGGSTLSEETLFWTRGEDTIRVVLDHQGKFIEIAHEVPKIAEAEPLPEPKAQPKPGLMARLFGNRR